MEVLPELAENGFFRGVGPGVWDIHSPRVPSVEELVELITEAVRSVPANRLWVNPDCGLKTRAYPETVSFADESHGRHQAGPRDTLTRA